MKISELLDEIQSKHPKFEAISNLMAHLSLPDLSPDALIDLAHSLNEGTAKNYRFITDKSIDENKIEKQTTTIKHWNAIRSKLPISEIPEELSLIHI